MIVELEKGRVISPISKINITGKFVLTKHEKKLSDPQRRYYWGVLVKEVSEYTGYTKDEVHGKFGYLTRRSKNAGIPRIRSLTELTTKEVEEANEFIRMYFAEKLGLNLPLPNEVDYSQIKQE